MKEKVGYISQIIGPVVDVSFEVSGDELPKIHEALEIERENGTKLVIECQQHIGEHTIRAIAMDSTDGLRRGMKVVAKGDNIRMPIGKQIRGRLLNVVGETIDGLGELSKEGGRQYSFKPPKYEELSTETEILYTGSIKSY